MSRTSNKARCVCPALAGGSQVRQLHGQQGFHHQVVDTTAAVSGKSIGIFVSEKVFILPLLEQPGQSNRDVSSREWPPSQSTELCYHRSTQVCVLLRRPRAFPISPASAGCQFHSRATLGFTAAAELLTLLGGGGHTLGVIAKIKMLR